MTVNFEDNTSFFKEIYLRFLLSVSNNFSYENKINLNFETRNNNEKYKLNFFYDSI